MPKRVVFNPEFLEEVKIKEGKDVARRSVTARRNTSTYYCYLYQTLFGGGVSNHFKIDTERMVNGERRLFHPDLIKKAGKKWIFTEVKSTSTQASVQLCSTSQVENYCYNLLLKLNKHKPDSLVEYAFFRYSYPKRENQVKLDPLSNQELVKELSKRKTKLLVVPLNLLFLILYHSRTNQPHRSFSTEQNYWYVPGRVIVELMNGKNDADKRVIDLYDSSLDNLLLLQNIDSETYRPKQRIFCGGSELTDLVVTRYYNITPKKWSDHFKQNHKEILTKVVGVRDIYHECKDVPF